MMFTLATLAILCATPLEIFGISMPWDAPSNIFSSITDNLGILLVGLILMVIGILVLVNRIEIGSPYVKWPVGFGMLVVGGYLLLVVI